MDDALYTIVRMQRGEKRRIVSMSGAHGQEKNVSFTAYELKAMEQRGEDRTNLEKVARASLADGADPDDAKEEVDWATAQLPMPRAKTHASFRVDADILDGFKAPGRGYRTRIDAAPRGYFEQRTR